MSADLSPRILTGQKSLFRVQLHNRDAGDESQTVYHPRRAHRKSRGGCQKCKLRRVKCDETKPHCLRCQKHGVDCTYAPIVKTVPTVAHPDPTAYSLSLSDIASKLDELLQPPGKRNQHISTTLHALHHFHAATATTISTIPDQNTFNSMRTKLSHLAFTSPPVMHAIIATSLSHLRHFTPPTTPTHKTYTLLESHHWHQSIAQYSHELSLGATPQNMDALFSTCLLLTSHIFSLDTFSPTTTSFVFTIDSNPQALTWLTMQSGLRHLIALTKPYLPQSIWFQTFMSTSTNSNNNNNNAYTDDHRPGPTDLHPDLAALCNIVSEADTESNNPYLWPLRMLTPLLGLERSPRSFPHYCNFMGRLLPEFYDCLRRRRTPALVILAWWLALMLTAADGVWWLGVRLRSELVAICMFLEEREGGEGGDERVRRLLRFPAGACGYVFRGEGAEGEGVGMGVDVDVDVDVDCGE